MREVFDFDNMFKAIFANELSNNHKLATKFSFAGNKNSGISYGYQQLDTKHNNQSWIYLGHMGFTSEECELIKKFNKISTKTYYKKWRFVNKEAVKLMEEKLRNNKDFLYELAKDKIQGTMNHILDNIRLEVELDSFTVLAHMIDYHNQFHFSINGKMHRWIKSLDDGTVITSQMILDFKLDTKWGKTKIGQKDVERRFFNVNKFNYYKDFTTMSYYKLKVRGRG